MSLLSRIEGKEPQHLPAGARAYVDGYGPLRDEFGVYYDEAGDQHLVRGAFKMLTSANMYRDWVNGYGMLDWDVNGVGMPV